MKQKAPANIELYKVVEHATRLVGEIQKESNQNQERLGYVSRRADRRLGNPHRIARIWSEGQLQDAERTFDLARDGKLEDDADKNAGRKKSRRKRGLETDPVDVSRDNLFSIWDSIRTDSGFRNATKRVKESITQAGSQTRQLEKHGKRLDLMLAKTIEAVRDMKQAMSAGIRQVPYEAAIEAGPDVSFEAKVAALQRISHAAMARAAPENAPQRAPTPNPRGGSGGAGDQGGREG
jgi:hypothetical protein